MATTIVDGNYMLHRCCHAIGELENRHGKPTEGVHGFLQCIQSVIANNQTDRCTVVFDAGVSKRRREIYPRYKGSRWRDRDDPLWEELDEEKQRFDDRFKMQLTYLSYILRRLGVRVIRIPGWEGDDLVYRIATLHSSGLVYVVSDDRDFYQIPATYSDSSIHLIRPMAGQIVTEENFEDLIGYPQIEFFIRKSVEGDSSDKIRGVENVGAGTLNKIFNEGAPVDAYPFEQFILYCMDHKSKRVRGIADQMDILIRNTELIDLEREPYPEEVAQRVHTELGSPVGVDLKMVRHFLAEMDLLVIEKKLHWWIVPFQRLR